MGGIAACAIAFEDPTVLAFERVTVDKLPAEYFVFVISSNRRAKYSARGAVEWQLLIFTLHPLPAL